MKKECPTCGNMKPTENNHQTRTLSAEEILRTAGVKKPSTLLERVNSRKEEINAFCETIAAGMLSFGITELKITMDGMNAKMEIQSKPFNEPAPTEVKQP